MFHISNYGKFSHCLTNFANESGFVPEKGDKHDPSYGVEKHEWEQVLQEAERAKKRADVAVNDWRNDKLFV